MDLSNIRLEVGMGMQVHVVEKPGIDSAPQLRWTGKLRPKETVTVGREGNLVVGVNPMDKRVSRHAATITAADRGWCILPTNRNGVTLYPWAQPSYPVSSVDTIVWPRIGVRIMGDPGLEHWVLLEDDEAYTKGAPRHTTGLTEMAQPIRPLTPAQKEAVRDVFHDVLAWPPRPAESRILNLKQVAPLLERTPSAVRQRLIEVRKRAEELGLARQVVELTDPEYIYALVKAGLIEPAPDDLRRPLR